MSILEVNSKSFISCKLPNDLVELTKVIYCLAYHTVTVTHCSGYWLGGLQRNFITLSPQMGNGLGSYTYTRIENSKLKVISKVCQDSESVQLLKIPLRPFLLRITRQSHMAPKNLHTSAPRPPVLQPAQCVVTTHMLQTKSRYQRVRFLGDNSF